MILLSSINICAQYSIISGLVTNSKTNEPLILGTVTLYSKGELVAYAETDFEGRYEFSGLQSSVYDVEVSFACFINKRIASIPLAADTLLTINISLEEGTFDSIQLISAGPPIIQFDAFTQGRTINLRNNGVIRQSTWNLD